MIYGGTGMEYITVETGLDLGTKFLFEKSAYFLGLLMADEQIIINGERYWIAPVRHNPKQYDDVELEQHYSIVKALGEDLNKSGLTHFISYYKNRGVTFEKFNAGKNGFVTLFKQLKADYSLDELIGDIQEGLRNSSGQVKRAFLVGVFDGRSSYDKTYKFISLDIENDKLVVLLDNLFSDLGITTNVNSLYSARKRDNPNAKPRKPQIRIKYLDFLKKVGYISPIRFSKSTVELRNVTIVELDDILLGLKAIR